MVLRIAQFFRNLHREEKGFTLIELLIVIAILAVLAAIAIPLVVNRIEQARESADKANVAQLQSAVDLYMLDYGAGKEGLVELNKDMAEDEWMETHLKGKGYLQKKVDSPYGGDYHYKLAETGLGNLIVESTAESDKWDKDSSGGGNDGGNDGNGGGDGN